MICYNVFVAEKSPRAHFVFRDKKGFDMEFNRTVVEEAYINNAIFGIRHSYDSESLSDSTFENGKLSIGEKDKKLIQTLIKSGASHRKFLRQIPVSVDITTSLEIWKQLDTYKISTVANSTSTMHTVTKYPFTIEMFETDGMTCGGIGVLSATINALNTIRDVYLVKNDDISIWYDIIGNLPESFKQTRMWTANYEVIRNICQQRKGHKMPQWKAFIEWAKTLPYAEEFDLTGKYTN